MELNVFELNEEYVALNQLLEEVDPVTGEFLNSSEDIKDYINKLEHQRNFKLESIERLKKLVKASADVASDEINRLQGVKKRQNGKIDRLSELQLMLTAGDKIETDLYKFGTRKSKSVNILDEALIQEKYKVEQPLKIDKKLITDDIKNGVEVAGAELIEKVSLSVR